MLDFLTSRFSFIDMNIKVTSKTIIADLYTPVSLFLKIRAHFHQVLLLESSDYSSKENSMSFLCFDPIAGLKVDKDTYTAYKQEASNSAPRAEINIVEKLTEFMNSFTIEDTELSKKFNGLFGFSSFDAIEDFEDITFNKEKDRDDIPVLRYDFYRYILCFDHFYEKLSIIENVPENEVSRINEIEQILSAKNEQSFNFTLQGEEQAKMTDQHFMEMVTKSKNHCHKGNVFQIVPSRRYSQKFSGDEFNVYRTLRSINPSPYLFYYDYGDFKIFGSSPEAQLIVQDGEVEIHPIAGTFKRTGDFNSDLASAEELKKDPKENAEHVMLVDLARNDLSKNLRDVKVKEYKTVQFFSHVIHLVSKLTAKMKAGINPYQIFADTFPAGTLSGAPKIKAMQIIDELEPHSRSYYGGGLGIIFFNGNLNHAIMIRSFLSKDNTLHYQAGAGIVIDSVEEKELQEVNNKLGALNKALITASEI